MTDKKTDGFMETVKTIVFAGLIAIGVRSFVREMTPWRDRGLDWAALGFWLLLVVLGFRAVWGVVA